MGVFQSEDERRAFAQTYVKFHAKLRAIMSNARETYFNIDEREFSEACDHLWDDFAKQLDPTLQRLIAGSPVDPPGGP